MFFLVHVVLVQVQEHLCPCRGWDPCADDAVYFGEDFEELGLLLAAAACGDAAVYRDASCFAVGGGLCSWRAGRGEEWADEAREVVVGG